MDALLDAVETEIANYNARLIASVSVPTQPQAPLQFAERRSTVKQPRKSNLQQRVLTPQPNLSEQSVISKPLSISPVNVDIPEESRSIPNDNLLTQYRNLRRSSSIDTLSVKSEPMDTDECQKRRLVQIPSNNSSSLSTKSFLISPPANPYPQKPKTSIPPVNTNKNKNKNNNNNSNNNNVPTFAPRLSSTTVSQKNNWPTNTAQKRPGPPPVVYPHQAQRNSNSNPPTTRMNPPTSLQPQSFDIFSVNPPIVQRRPNGVPSVPNRTPPVRVCSIVLIFFFSIYLLSRCHNFQLHQFVHQLTSN